MVFAPIGVAAEATGGDGAAAAGAVATGAVGPSGSGGACPVATGVVGPMGSGAFDRGIVFGPVVAAVGGAGGAGAEGGGGGVGALAAGAVVGAVVGRGAVTESVGRPPVIGAVEGAPAGTGEVEPFGDTGPESSGWAFRLMRTVSFRSGTVEVLTEGFAGS